MYPGRGGRRKIKQPEKGKEGDAKSDFQVRQSSQEQ